MFPWKYGRYRSSVTIATNRFHVFAWFSKELKLIQGDSVVIYIFVAFQQERQLLKVRAGSYRSEFFILRGDPFQKGYTVQGSKQKVIQVVSFGKTLGKTWIYTHIAHGDMGIY